MNSRIIFTLLTLIATATLRIADGKDGIPLNLDENNMSREIPDPESERVRNYLARIIDKDNKRSECLGTVIARHYVLGLRSCATTPDEDDTYQLEIGVGDTIYQIARIALHNSASDIAIFETKQDIRMENNEMAELPEFQRKGSYNMYTLTTQSIRAVLVTVTDGERCHGLTDGPSLLEVCVVKVPCTATPGSPIFNSHSEIVAIYARGEEVDRCIGSGAAAAISVSKFRNWIQTQIAD